MFEEPKEAPVSTIQSIDFKMMIFVVVSWIALMGCENKNNGNVQREKSSASLPQVSCKDTTYRFGKVDRGDDVTHTFTIKNTGRAQLKLLGTRTSCPCVIPHLNGTDIAPGQEGKLTVRLNTSRQKGKLNQTVILKTNDPNHKSISFQIEGQIAVLAAFEPDVVSFGDVLKSSTKSTEIHIVGTKISDMKPGKLVSSKPDKITAEFISGKDRTVRVTLKAPAEQGRLTGSIRLSTGLDNPKEIRARVMARVSSDLITDRSYALFSEKLLEDDHLDPNNQPVYLIHVRSLTNRPFRITGVRDPLGVVTGQAKPTKGGWKVEMKLSKKPTQKRGEVLIDTDRKDQPTLSVKYIIRAKESSGASFRPRLKARAGINKPLMRVNPKEVSGSNNNGRIKLNQDVRNQPGKIKRLNTHNKTYPQSAIIHSKTDDASK